LLLILALAAALRFWQLAQMPPGFYHDEAYDALDGLSLVQGKTFPQFYEGWELYQNDAHANRPPTPTRWPLFFEGNYGREPLYMYLNALAILLMGPTPFAVRAVTALAGTLAVFTTFLAAKALFAIGDWEMKRVPKQPSTQLPSYRSPLTNHQLPITILAPLVAAFTLAILFPAIHFSRFGLRVMVFLPIATLTVYCFWQGVARGGRPTAAVQANWWRRYVANGTTAWFIAAGFLLGLGFYTYAAGRLLPLLFILFIPFWFWRERAAVRPFGLPVALMAGTAVLTALPLLLYFWRYPYFFVFRMAYVSNRGKGAVEGKPWLTWLQNVGRVVAGLFWQGETHRRHNLPGRPYLDAIQSLFFVIGIAATIRQLFHPRLFFLYLWLIVMLLPTILSGDAPHFGRLSGAAPVVAIFVGLGFDRVVAMVRKRLTVNNEQPRFKLFTAYCLLFTLLLANAGLAIYDYFGRYAQHPQLAADFYRPEWEMGQFAASFGPETVIYLTPTQEELATLYFALGGSERLQNYAGEEGAVPLGIPGRGALYLVRPSAPVSLHNLQNLFPNSVLGEPGDGYIPFYVPANTPRQMAEHESHHTFGDQIRLVGWTVTEQEGSTAVTLIWESLTKIEQDYTVFVHLMGPTGRPIAQLDRQPGGHPTSSWQPGEWVLDTFIVPRPSEQNAAEWHIETGFYYLPTLERLGEPAILSPATSHQ
jgi:4-amino-4-deoxy-L-arabinose transferase-like glycosyltransferase